MTAEHAAQKIAKYDLLIIRIEGHLKAYRELLTDYEAELKGLLKQDVPYSIIEFQHTLISKTKAKISALEELN